jgi:hypothetical protein
VHCRHRIVLTYNLSPAALRELGLETGNWFAGVATEMGEPFVTLFKPDEAEALVRGSGFDEVVELGPKHAVETYFAGRDDVRLHPAQRLIVARVAEQAT